MSPKPFDFQKCLSSTSLSHLSGKPQSHMAPTEELKPTCWPFSIPLNSLAVGRQCGLCAGPLVEAYHFTPTCPRWSAHEPQNKTLSVFSFVEICPLCVWPGRGLSYLSKVDPCVFFTAVHTGILPLFQRKMILANIRYSFPTDIL